MKPFEASDGTYYRDAPAPVPEKNDETWKWRREAQMLKDSLEMHLDILRDRGKTIRALETRLNEVEAHNDRLIKENVQLRSRCDCPDHMRDHS